MWWNSLLEECYAFAFFTDFTQYSIIKKMNIEIVYNIVIFFKKNQSLHNAEKKNENCLR